MKSSESEVVLWSHVINEIHCMSICKRPMYTKLCQVLTYFERLTPLKPHDPFIAWPTWGHVTIWKIYVSTLTRLMATKLGMLLTSVRRFSTQTLKFSSTFWLILIMTIAWYYDSVMKPINKNVFNIFKKNSIIKEIVDYRCI